MLDREVEALRAKLAAMKAGEPEPELEAESESGERKRTVVDYWFAEYERIHGCRDDAFHTKDAAILHRLAKQFPPSERFAWMIREFLGSSDEWTERGGWAVQQLASRVRGLNLRWVKEVQEPQLRREKAELEREIREFAASPRVLALVKKVGGE